MGESGAGLFVVHVLCGLWGCTCKCVSFTSFFFN
jgi:hypothetical protein